MVLLLTGAVATSVLFSADAFFAFAGWRVAGRAPTWGRSCVVRAHAFAEKRAPFLLAIAMASAIGLALMAGPERPRAACLASGALVALGAHLLAYMKTSCLVRGFGEASIGSSEWLARAARVETAMVTRASLLGAALICIVAAGLMT